MNAETIANFVKELNATALRRSGRLRGFVATMQAASDAAGDKDIPNYRGGIEKAFKRYFSKINKELAEPAKLKTFHCRGF